MESNKATWVAAAALCVTLMSGVYSLTVVPLKETVVSNAEVVKSVENRVDQLEKTQHGLQVELVYIKDSLKRIENAVVEEK